MLNLQQGSLEDNPLRLASERGDREGTAPLLTQTFGCRARGTKAEATKGHVQPQNGERGSQQPHGHSTQQIHAGISSLFGHRGKGKGGMGNSSRSRTARLRPALAVCPIVLNYRQAWNAFLPGIDPRSSPNEEKKLQQNTYRDVPLGKTWAAPLLPLSFPQLHPPGLLGLNTNHTGKKEAQGKPL